MVCCGILCHVVVILWSCCGHFVVFCGICGILWSFCGHCVVCCGIPWYFVVFYVVLWYAVIILW